MANGLVVGGMPDTMEYYSLFHIALKEGGVMELLYTMFSIVIAMIGMYLTIDRLALMLRNIK